MPRGNPQNLIPTNRRSKEEVRKNAAIGGKKSGETRRARKTLKEELLLILSDGDIQNRMSLALVKEAMDGNKAGSVTKAFEVIRDTVGEKPIDKIIVAEVDQSIIDEVEKMVNGDDSGTSC